MLSSELVIRPALKSDCKQLLVLMKKLAEFEDYLNDFRVTEDDLIEHGFPSDNRHPPTFYTIVAEQENQLLGYVVYYFIPFTYDLKPTLFIKELYINASSRGQKVGQKIMLATIEEAKEKGCGRMKWDVLNDNINAQEFYKQLGASYDSRWQGYVLNV
ncbi:MAG: GNAT family N-acetyltransferase [Cocleimonas sp.]